MGFRYATGRLGQRRGGEITEFLTPSDDTFLCGNSVELLKNYGAWSGGGGNQSASDKNLFRFILNSIPPSKTLLSASLYLTQSVASAITGRTHSIYYISDSNGDWVEGTKGYSLAGVNEPCWNAKKADGSGGVNEAWAGSAGCGTAGVDYNSTLLARITSTSSDPLGKRWEFVFNENGISTINSWFGQDTNNGLIIVRSNWLFNFYFKEYATAGDRPILKITYQ